MNVANDFERTGRTGPLQNGLPPGSWNGCVLERQNQFQQQKNLMDFCSTYHTHNCLAN